MDFSTLVLLAVFSSMLPYMWTIPFLILPRLRLIKVTQSSEVGKIRAASKLASVYVEGKPSGLMISGKFAAFHLEEKSERGGTDDVCYILSTKSYYEANIRSNKTMANGTYKCVIPAGNVWRMSFNPTINKVPVVKYKWQREIMPMVLDHYEIHKVCTILLSGKPNMGKSTLGPMLAEHFKSMCVIYNPLKPYALRNIYEKANSGMDKPLVVCIDEIDVILRDFNYVKNNHVLPDVISYSDWNNLLSNLCLGSYGHIILVATTNVSLDDLDSGKCGPISCTREGRFNFRMQINSIN
jgi:hypothetical protein